MTKLEIISLIKLYASILNFDPNVALSVAKTESNLNVNAIGPIGEVGLFQIRPEFVKGITKEELFNPRTNIIVGINKLKEVKDRCKHRYNYTWLVCYNLGIKGGSRIKHPSSFIYYKKVLVNMREGNK